MRVAVVGSRALQADLVLAFWDGKSRGTKFVIDTCRTRKIPIRVILLTETKRVTTR